MARLSMHSPLRYGLAVEHSEQARDVARVRLNLRSPVDPAPACG
jgi:hypothetical protein